MLEPSKVCDSLAVAHNTFQSCQRNVSSNSRVAREWQQMAKEAALALDAQLKVIGMQRGFTGTAGLQTKPTVPATRPIC
jgi:hypothetical protein